MDGAGGIVWIKIWIRTKNEWSGWNIMNQGMNKNWMDGTGGISWIKIWIRTEWMERVEYHELKELKESGNK